MPIIVITAFGNLETAVRALEGGAFDYLVKPFDLDQATTVVKRSARETAEPRAEPRPGRPEAGRAHRLVAGDAGAVQEHRAGRADRRAGADHGRERDRQGAGRPGDPPPQPARRDGPFLPICLAALSPGLVERELFGHVKGSFTGAVQDRKGLLELASGGTVLLDEIGDVSPSLQVKLLRAIEHRK